MTTKSFFTRMTALWVFIISFKLAGTIHYSLISPYGEKLFPLWIVGIIMGGIALIQLILDVPTGWVIDKYGETIFLKIGTVFFIISCLALLPPLTKTTYLISSILSAFGWIFYGPSISSFILSRAPTKMTGRLLSYSDTFSSLGVICGTVAVTFLIRAETSFVAQIMSLVFFIALIAMFFIEKNKKLKEKQTEGLRSRHHRIQFKIDKKMFKALKGLNPPAMALVIKGFCTAMFYSTVWFVLPLIMISGDKTSIISGLGLGIFDFAIFITGIALGKVVDKFNKATTTFVGLLIFAVTSLAVGFNFTWLFLVIGFLAAVGDELSHLSLWAWLNKIKRKDNSEIDYGLISGIVTLFQDLGWALGPIISGLVYNYIGGSLTIALGGSFILISWLAYQLILFFEKRNNKENIH